MAVVNFRLDQATLKGALDDVFNEVGLVLEVYLANNGVEVSGTRTSISFNAAAYNSTGNYAYVNSGAVIIPISAGQTINQIYVVEDDPSPRLYITAEPITPRTYSSVGSYTISDLIIELGE